MSGKKTLAERIQKIEDAFFDCNGNKGVMTKVSEMYDYIVVRKAFRKRRKWWVEVIFVVLIAGIVGLLTHPISVAISKVVEKIL